MKQTWNCLVIRNLVFAFLLSIFVFPKVAQAQTAASTPTISVASGTSSVQFNVTVSDSTPGATLYYTTDGSTPTTSSTTITSGGTLLVSKSESLNVIAVASGYSNSAVASATYQLTGQIAAGFFSTIALKTDGSVWSWGYNSSGQLGDGTTIQRTSAVSVSGLTGCVAVASGNYHGIALKNDGTVWTWGLNSSGQLGDKTTTQRKTPVQVKDVNSNPITGVVAIAGGAYHGLALKSDGTVWAWGLNSNGQLGDGTTIQKNYAVQVSGLTGIVSISSGFYHNMALKSDGTLWTWGLNTSGQIGDGTTIQRVTPVQISTVSNIATIATGDYTSLILKNTGVVWTWGGGTLSPVQFASLTGVVEISTYLGHVIALKSDGTVWSWGSNFNGQLGTGGLSTAYSAVQMLNTSGAMKIAAGNAYNLITKNDGSVWGCGADSNGQLGDGATNFRPNAVSLLSMTSVVTASAKGLHTLLLKNDGTVWSFGDNISGQLGDGTLTTRYTPVQVGSGFSGAISVATGGFHSVALKNDGTVWTWGLNSNGQLGDGTTTQRTSPVHISGLSNVAAISAGYSHTVALKNDGTVWAWGLNSNGQLGDGTTAQRTSPVQVAGLSGIVAIASGQYHNLALRSDGTLWAWGLNANGQIGDNTTTLRNTPVRVFGLNGITAISAGNSHSLALRSDKTAWAWGLNSNGQLGDGTTTQRLIPVQTSGLIGVTAISAGDVFSLAFTSGNTVMAWGINSNGQLGDGTTTQHTAPVQCNALSGITSISAGAARSFVVKQDGTVQGFGQDNLGQLGVGNNATVLYPIPGFNILSGSPLPAVAITAPANNAAVPLGQTKTFTASASESGGSIASVSYYIDSTLIGSSTSSGGSYSVSWTPSSWGSYSFIAIATDSAGHTSFLSSPITVNVPYDSDGNGLPDWWEIKNLGQLGNNSNASDSSQSGFTLGDDYQQKRNPTQSVTLPSVITVQQIDLQSQTTAQGSFASLPVTFQALDASNNPVSNFSITVSSSINLLAASVTGSASSSVQLSSDSSGLIQVYVKVPSQTQVQYISSTTGTHSGAAARQVTNDGVFSYSQNILVGSPPTLGVQKVTNYFSSGVTGLPNTLQVTGGDNQLSPISGFAPQPLVVQLTDSNGNPVANTAVTFQLNQGASVSLGGRLSATNSGTTGLVQTLRVNTDSSGNAQVYFYQTPYFSGSSEINAAIVPANTDLSRLQGILTFHENVIRPLSNLTPMMAGGGNHSVALKNDGTVWAWGDNSVGQLGDGTTTAKSSPVKISGIGQIVKIAAGGGNTMALANDGTIWAWGDDSYNQLGDQSVLSVILSDLFPTFFQVNRIKPVHINGLSHIVDIAAVRGTFFVVRDDGTLWKLGESYWGYLGLATYNKSAGLIPIYTFFTKGPQAVNATNYSNYIASQLGNNFISLSAGPDHVAALRKDGTVCTWGADTNGDLGSAQNVGPTIVSSVPGVAGMVAVAAGNNFTLALSKDGTVWSWGAAIVNGQSVDNRVPTQISGLSGIIAIKAGLNHAIALKNDGTVWTWGFNTGTNNQLGDSSVTQRSTPTAVSGVSNIISIATGSSHSFAVKNDGTVYDWGNNVNGSLGLGFVSSSALPNLIPSFNLFVGFMPVVSITSPANNSTGMVGLTQTFQASATETSGTITSVQYYQGANLIGQSDTSPYTISWTPTAMGSFSFTAIAVDVNGLASIPSAAVTVQVTGDVSDLDGNGLADAWEIQYFGHTGNNSTTVLSNGLTLLQDFQQGNDPTNYFSQNGDTVTPAISVVAGDGQNTQAAYFAPVPLKVQVTGNNGKPLFNAPVTFVVTSGTGQVAPTILDIPASSQQVVTDSNGFALVYYLQPSVPHTAGAITASSGGQSVTFSAISTGSIPGDGTFDAPTNVVGTPSAISTSEIDLTWQNNASTATSIIIQESTDGSTWTTVATLTNTSLTSYAVTGLTSGQSYYFQVLASKGTTSTATAGSGSPTTTGSTPPPASSAGNLSGILDPGGTMTISWPSAAGATSYQVERQSIGGTWTVLGTTTSPSYADTTRTGGGYRYRVSSIDSNGTSAPSAVFPAPQYAIIDLGPSMTPKWINNLGTVVLSDTSGASFFWKSGTPTPIPSAIHNLVGLDNHDRVAGTVDTGNNPKPPPYGAAVTYTQAATCIPGGSPTPLNDAVQQVLSLPTGSGNLGSHLGTTWQADGYSFYNGASAVSDSTVAGRAGITVYFFIHNDDGTPGYPVSNTYVFDGGGAGAVEWVGGADGHLAGDFLVGASFGGFSVTASGTNSFVPSGVNNSGVMIGWAQTSGNCKMDASGDITPLGFTPIDINNAGQIIGDNGAVYPLSQTVSHLPIKINNNGAQGQVLDNAGWLWTYSNDKQKYQPQNLADYLPDSDWTSVGVTSMNDFGAFIGTATYTGSATSVTPGVHGVIILPIDLVQETNDGSGQYQTIDAAPVFPNDNGVGRGAQPNQSSPKGVFVLLSSELSTTTAGSMTVSIGGPGGYFSGTLTETAANSGVFVDSSNTVTLTLPVGTTTSSSHIDVMTATVNSSTLGFSNINVSLVESDVDSLYFGSPVAKAEIIFSNAYNPSLVNSIQVKLLLQNVDTTGSIAPYPSISLSMSETSAGSKTFVDSSSGLTVSLTNFTGTNSGSVDSLVVSLSGGAVGSTAISTTLLETTATSMDFTSLTTTGDTGAASSSDTTPDNPQMTGDGVFYIRMKGISSPVTLAVQTNVGAPQQVTLSPDPNNPSTLISGKMLIIPQDSNGPSSYANIPNVLEMAADTASISAPNTTLNVTGITESSGGVSTPLYNKFKSATGMFLGMSFLSSQGVGDALKAETTGHYFDESLHHLDRIKPIVDSNLGLRGNSVPDLSTDKTDFLTAIPNFRFMYLMSHSWSEFPQTPTTPAVQIPFQTLWVDQPATDDNYLDHEISPSEVAGVNKNHKYRLVFLNCCNSANTTAVSPPGLPAGKGPYDNHVQDMVDAFNCQAYVGWTQAVGGAKSLVVAQAFFSDLSGNKSVDDAIGQANAATLPSGVAPDSARLISVPPSNGGVGGSITADELEKAQ